MAKCHKLRSSKKNRQELLKGKKGAKDIRASLFFPNSNGYLNWDPFLSSNFVMRSTFAKLKSSVTNVTLFMITDNTKILLYQSVYASFFHQHTATMHKKECRPQKKANFKQ